MISTTEKIKGRTRGGRKLLSREKQKWINCSLETGSSTTAKMEFLSTEMMKGTNTIPFSGKRRSKFQFWTCNIWSACQTSRWRCGHQLILWDCRWDCLSNFIPETNPETRIQVHFYFGRWTQETLEWKWGSESGKGRGPIKYTACISEYPT